MILSSVLYLIGAVITAFAPVYVVMVIGRFVYGVGIGLVRYFQQIYIFMNPFFFACEYIDIYLYSLHSKFDVKVLLITQLLCTSLTIMSY